MEVLGYKIFPCQEGPSAELVADVLSVTREEKHRGPASEQIIAIPEWDGRGEKICLDYLGTGIKLIETAATIIRTPPDEVITLGPCIVRLDPEMPIWKAHPLTDQALSVFKPVDCTLDIGIYYGLSKSEALAGDPHHEPTIGPNKLLGVLGGGLIKNIAGTPMVVWAGFASKCVGLADTSDLADFMKAVI